MYSKPYIWERCMPKRFVCRKKKLLACSIKLLNRITPFVYMYIMNHLKQLITNPIVSSQTIFKCKG